MPLAPRERLPVPFRRPRHPSRVPPVPLCPLACRGGDYFPAGPYLDLYICPAMVFNQNSTSKCHKFLSTYPICVILFPMRL
ncbi:hypothetical protein Hanom_Chr12g01157771 [Helianthus anomalus]